MTSAVELYDCIACVCLLQASHKVLLLCEIDPGAQKASLSLSHTRLTGFPGLTPTSLYARAGDQQDSPRRAPPRRRMRPGELAQGVLLSASSQS